MDPKVVPPLLAAALLVFAILRRMRRSFGRQRVQPRRLIARMVILAVLGALLAIGSLGSPELGVALLAGCAGGAALGYFGLRHTRFEVSAEGRFYTPHVYLGVAVTALFLGRILYRLLTYHRDALALGAAPANPLMAYDGSPLTGALFGVLLGYYAVYYTGVLRRTRPEPVPPSPAPVP
jgi:hypothetical protein